MPVVSGRGPQGTVDCMMEVLWISFILEHPTDSHLDWDMHCFKAGSTLWACVMVFVPIVLPGDIFAMAWLKTVFSLVVRAKARSLNRVFQMW